MTIPVRVDLTVSESTQQFDVTVSENSIPVQVGIDTQIVAGTSDEYEGPYSVTPSEQAQTLATNELLMTDDVTVSAIPSDYVGSDVPRHDSSDLVASGATVSVPAGHYAENASKSIQNATIANSTNVTANPTLTVDYSTGEITASVSKTQSVSVVTSAGYAPVTSHDVVVSGSAGTQLITHDSSDLTVSGPTVTAPDGYYPNSASKSVQSGSATTPTLGIEATPNIAISNSGKITSSVSKSESITPVVSEGYVTAGTAGTVTFAGSNTLQLNTKSGTTITPTESQQVAVDQNRWTTGQVKVGAIPSSYVGSGVTRNDSTDLVVSDDTVTAPSGYYESNASATVQSATWKSASTVGVVPEITVSSSGLITANCAGWTSCKPLSASGYADADTSANIQLAGVKTSQLDTVAATTYTPNKVSTQEIPAGKYTTGIQTIGKIPDEYIVPSGTKSITSNGTGIDVTSYASVDVAVPSQPATLQSKTKSYTPSETAQSETVSADAGYDGLSSVDVSVGAISSTYVGSGIDRRDSTDLSASGATVSVPKGFYENNASKAVSSGSATAPASISGLSASVSTGTNTLTLSKTVSVTPSVTAGYVSSGTAGNSSVSLTASVTTQGATTITPTTSSQTAVSSGTYCTGAVTVSAMPSGTAGTPTATKGTVSSNSVTVTPSVTNTTGYITGGTLTGTAVTVSASELVSGTKNITASGTTDVTNYASASVAAGTAGTPTATKGAVSNHSVSVTPSVTNTTGYITGSTKTGTAVTVSASELVSGSETKTTNGTYDVTNLAELVVNVSGGGGSSKNFQYVTGRYEVANSAYTATDLEIKVAKAGTYKCYWVMDRNTTSGTSGSRLYNGSTALGTAHTTWSHTNNTRVQECEETLTFALNDTITVRVRSRSTSYYAGVTNFFIVEQ